MATAKKSAAAPAAAPAAKATPVLTFDDAPVPEKVRESTGVNPMTEACKALAATFDKETGQTAMAKTVTAPDAAYVKSIKRWLSECSSTFGITFRSTVDKETLKVTFWGVTKIVHTKKAAAESAPLSDAAKSGVPEKKTA